MAERLKPIPPRTPKKKTCREKGYDRKWREYSKQRLCEFPLCVVCGSLAELTDHIIPVESGGSMWDVNNHQSMCWSCHSKKTVSENR